MARIVAPFAFVLALTLMVPPVFAAADQGSAHPLSSAPRKPVKPKKVMPRNAKIPEVKAPATKAVQPPAVIPTVPSKPEDANPADTKGNGAKPAETKPTETKPTVRFASLRAEKVNLRSGPGEDFPIQWVFVRRGLPIEILANFDIWRKIRAFDGTEGWVHQQMLTGRRSVLITDAIRDLRRDPDDSSGIVAQLEPGVVASVSHCNPGWCEIKAGGYKGWLKRGDFWGLEPDEVIP